MGVPKIKGLREVQPMPQACLILTEARRLSPGRHETDSLSSWTMGPCPHVIIQGPVDAALSRCSTFPETRGYGARMHLMITGVDEHGRSCVTSDGEVTFAGGTEGGGFSFADLFSTSTSPPPVRPAGRADFVDLGIKPGLIRWLAVDYAPGAATHRHHTDTIDFGVVLSGSVELILDDGAHQLGAGACVVMNGVDHEWRAGPTGCRLSVLSIGTPPPG